MGFGFEGVGDRQPFQNIIITILNHEHFPHGTSTFNRNSVLHHSFFPYEIKMKILNKKVCHGRRCNIATTSFVPTLGCYDDDVCSHTFIRLIRAQVKL
jgi:hypothetical protein